MTLFDRLKSRPGLIIFTILASVTALIYIPTLWYCFIFDDFPTIVEYQHIKVFDFWQQFFANSRWISRIIHKGVYQLWGIFPTPFRVVNLLLNLVTAGLIFSLLIAVCKNLKKNSFLKNNAYLFSSIVTGLFLFHPAQTQTVTYITQMTLEGLVVFFYFAVISAYFFATIAKNMYVKIGLYGLAFVLTALSTGSKEIIIVLPCLLILFDWFLIAEGEWSNFKSRIPLLALQAVFFFGVFYKVGVKPRFIKRAVTTSIRNNRGNILTEEKEEKITPGNFFISQFKIITHYIAMFFWPFNICFDYEVVLSKSLWERDVIFPLIFLLLILFGALIFFIFDPGNLFTFSVGWFFGAVFPRASFVPCTELVCDYKTYVGSFGMMFFIALLVMYGMRYAAQHFRQLTLLRNQVVVVVLLLAGLGVMSKIRNKVWSTELLFWKDCIDNAPSKARGWNNYAVALWDLGRVDEAIKSFQDAIVRDANYGEPHVNLAVIYQMQGKKDQAFHHYQKALSTGEGHPQLFLNLGILHISNNNLHSAEYCLKQAIELRAFYGKAYTLLGRLYEQQKRFDEATKIFEEGLRYVPEDAELHYSYASLQHNLGNFEKARLSFEVLDKNYMDTAFLLGSCYYNKSDYRQAASCFAVAYNRDKNNLVYAYNYGQALKNIGMLKEAIPLFVQCKSRQDLYAYAPMHLAYCFHEVGDTSNAIKTLNEILQTSPHQHVKAEAVGLLKQINKKG